MLSRDSDLGALESNVKPPLSRSLRKWFETVVVMAGLMGGGVAIGYWAGIQQEREDRIAEIDRLRQAYENRLSSLSGRVAEAADTAAGAAIKADDAAQAAAKAAEASKSAPKEK